MESDIVEFRDPYFPGASSLERFGITIMEPRVTGCDCSVYKPLVCAGIFPMTLESRMGAYLRNIYWMNVVDEGCSECHAHQHSNYTRAERAQHKVNSRGFVQLLPRVETAYMQVHKRSPIDERLRYMRNLKSLDIDVFPKYTTGNKPSLSLDLGNSPDLCYMKIDGAELVRSVISSSIKDLRLVADIEGADVNQTLRASNLPSLECLHIQSALIDVRVIDTIRSIIRKLKQPEEFSLLLKDCVFTKYAVDLAVKQWSVRYRFSKKSINPPLFRMRYDEKRVFLLS